MFACYLVRSVCVCVYVFICKHDILENIKRIEYEDIAQEQMD
jgi:hypothetical protein